MTCFECGTQDSLNLGDVNVTGERNGQSFHVQVPGLACSHCGFNTVDSDQSLALTKAVSDAYRTANGLLTGVQIVEYRNQLGMNQQAFADYLGTGVASVKRWEAGKVQDRAMDQLIRVKADPEEARALVRTLEVRIAQQHVVSTVTLEGRIVDLSVSFGRQSFGGSDSALRKKWSVGSNLVYDLEQPLAA